MAKRIKKVFSSQPACIHRWAMQIQDEGVCKAFGNKALYFEGKNLYSNWPKHVGQWCGEKYLLGTFAAAGIVLANTDHTPYIATGSYHRRAMYRVLRSMSHIKRFDVPSDAMFGKPVEVLQALVERYRKAMDRARRSRGRLVLAMRAYDECAKQVREYAELYGLEQPNLLAFNEQGEKKLRYRMAKAMVIDNKMRAERGW